MKSYLTGYSIVILPSKGARTWTTKVKLDDMTSLVAAGDSSPQAAIFTMP